MLKKKYQFSLYLLVFFMSGCATKNKIDYIAQDEIKIKYIIPDMKNCDELPHLNGNHFSDLYAHSKVLTSKYNECNLYNREKKEWIERNIKQ